MGCTYRSIAQHTFGLIDVPSGKVIFAIRIENDVAREIFRQRCIDAFLDDLLVVAVRQPCGTTPTQSDQVQEKSAEPIRCCGVAQQFAGETPSVAGNQEPVTQHRTR